MRFTLNIEGFEGQIIEVKISFWSEAKLFINGKPVLKEKNSGQMLLKRNDGRQVISTWKTQFLGLDTPQLIVDDKAIKLTEPLKWYQWVWCALPLALIFWASSLSIFIGIIGFYICTYVFRTSQDNGLKYVFSGIISVLIVIVYFAVSSLIIYFLRRI